MFGVSIHDFSEKGSGSAEKNVVSLHSDTVYEF